MRTWPVATCVVFLLCPAPCHTAFEPASAGARSAALGGAFLAVGGDLGAGLNNPAGLGGLSGVHGVVWTIPSVFGIEGLSRTGLAAGFTIMDMPIAIGVATLGYQAYRETEAAVSLALPLGDASTLGLRARCNVLTIGGYGSAVVPAFDAGCRVGLSRTFALACLLTNASAARIGAAGESLPMTLSVGCSWSPGETGVVLHAAGVREMLSPLEWRAGVEFEAIPILMLRFGCVSDPSLLCGGFGVRIAPFAIDYAATHHWQLGVTHMIAVSAFFE